MPKTKTKGEYVAVVGITYPTAQGEVFVKPGEGISDLPDRSVKWLREQGLIIAADDEKEA